MADTNLQIILKLRNELGDSLRQVRGQLGQLAEQLDALGLSGKESGTKTKDGLEGAGEAARGARPALDQLGQGSDLLASKFTTLVNGVRTLIAGFVALRAFQLARDLAQTAGRTETLNTVLMTVGNNAGFSSAKLREMDKAVQSMGITAAASRQSLTNLIQSGLISAQQTEKAAQLARAAQDLAVVSGQNSSETLQRMIINIQQLDTVGLRHMGIMVSVEEATEKYARQLGTTASALSRQEKQQAFMNAVLEEAGKLAGTYEASMGDAAKQAASLARYQENLKVSLGNNLLPAYLAVVEGVTELLQVLRLASDEFGRQGEGAVALGNGIRSLFTLVNGLVGVLVEYQGLLKGIAALYLALKVPAAFTALLGLFGLATARAQTMSVMLRSIWLGIPAMSVSGLTALQRLTVGFQTLGLAARVAGGHIAAAMIGWEIGKVLNNFKIVRDVANLVVTAVASSVEDAILASEALFIRARQGFQLFANFITRGGDDAAEEISKLADAEIDRIVRRQEGLRRMREEAWDNVGAPDRADIIKQAEQMVDKIVDTRAQINEAKRDIAGLQTLAKEGDTEALRNIATAQTNLKKLEAELKGQEKAFSQWRNQQTQENKDRAFSIYVDADVDEAQMRRELEKARTELSEAVKNGGFDKIKIFDNVRVTEQFALVAAAFDAMLRRFKSPLTGDIKDASDDVVVSINQITSAIESMGEQAKTPEELSVVLRRVEDTLKSLGEGSDDARVRLNNLRSNLRFRQEASEVERLNQQTSAFVERLRLVTDTMTLQRSVQRTLADGQRDYAQVINELGLSISRVASLATALREPINGLTASIKIAGEQDAERVRTQFEEYRTQYTNDLNAFNQALQRKRELIAASDRTEAEKATARATLERTSVQERVQISKTYFDNLRTLQQEALSRFRSYADQVKALDQEIADTQRARSADVREIRRSLMSEEEAQNDRMFQLSEQRDAIEKARTQGRLDDVKRLTQEQIDLAKQMALDENLPESRRLELLNLVESGYTELERTQAAQRSAAMVAAQEQAKVYEDVTDKLRGVSEQLISLSNSAITRIGFEVDDAGLRNAVEQIRNQLSNITATVRVVVNGSGNTFSQVPGYAWGGAVRGPGTGTSDSILSWLSNGEYVLRSAAVEAYGTSLLDQMNSLAIPPSRLPAYAGGGATPGAASAGSRDMVDINLNIGGRRLTLMGERSQAKGVIEAFRQFGA